VSFCRRHWLLPTASQSDNNMKTITHSTSIAACAVLLLSQVTPFSPALRTAL